MSLIKDELNKAEKELLEQAILEFNRTRKSAYKILHLLQSDIKEMLSDGKKVKQQWILINLSKSINISYETYRNFYYTHIKNKPINKKQNDKNITKKISSTSLTTSIQNENDEESEKNERHKEKYGEYAFMGDALDSMNTGKEDKVKKHLGNLHVKLERKGDDGEIKSPDFSKFFNK